MIQLGDYEIEPEASTSGIGFDYEVITTQPPVQVVENEIIYSYSTPQPSGHNSWNTINLSLNILDSQNDHFTFYEY